MKQTAILAATVTALLLVASGALRLPSALLRTGAQDIAFAQSGSNYDVEWSVMGSAGDQFVSGTNYQMGFTLAPDQASLISSGSNYQIVRGFWSGTGAGPTIVTLSSFSAKPSAGPEASPVWLWLVGAAALVMGGVVWVRKRLNTRGNSK